jgi:hypothetical protein
MKIQFVVLLLTLEVLLVACGSTQMLGTGPAQTSQGNVSPPEPTITSTLTPALILTPLGSLTSSPTLMPTSASIHTPTSTDFHSMTSTPLPSPVPTATPVSLRTLCEEPTNPPDYWMPCSEYDLSPTGTWAIFYWGVNLCGSGIAVVDLRTDEVQILVGEGYGESAEFISENEILYLVNTCEGHRPYVKNLESGEVIQLGAHEVHKAWHWNPQRTVVVGESSGSYCGWGTSLYGYSLTRHRKLSISGYSASDSHPIWTPDGTHLLFQRRTFTSTGWITSTSIMFQEIFILDSDSGESSSLLSHPVYDYWLCPQDCTWNGDQIEVVRTAAYTVTVPSLPCEDHSGYTVNTACLDRGENCPGDREWFMLNWRTGELASYDK